MTEVSAPKKTTGPGWYSDSRWPGERRRWDGQKWLDDWRPEPVPLSRRPEGYMITGAILAVSFAVATSVAFALNETAGWWALWASCVIAGVVFNIGLVAKAVEVGVRAARR